MARIEKSVQKFIQPYQNANGQFWRVSIPDGHGGQIRKQGFISKSDATEFTVKKYMSVLSEAKGVKTIQTPLTFRDFSLEWLAAKRRSGLAEATAMRYEDHIRIRLIPYFGCFKMMELEKFHLKNFIRENQNEGSSTANLKHSVSVFKAIIRQAEIDDHIPTKGILVVPTPKHKNKKPEFWDILQMRYFLNATKHSKYSDLWTFALFTGMRAGEISGLKWECIYLDKSFGGYSGAIEVKRTYNQKTRQMQETTKNGDRRIIPILPQIREVLARLKQTSDGDFVFGGKEHLDSSHFSRLLQSEEIEGSTLPKISFHKLRHSFCSYLDSTGMSRRIVSQIMGHRDLSTTDKYSHVNDQMLGTEMARWLEMQNQQKSNNLRAVNF